MCGQNFYNVYIVSFAFLLLFYYMTFLKIIVPIYLSGLHLPLFFIVHLVLLDISVTLVSPCNHAITIKNPQ